MTAILIIAPQALIRQVFAGANGYPDPYQATARDALCRILNAAEAAEIQTEAVGEVVAYFLADPPTSLLFDAPARQAVTLAKKLEALARELRKGVAQLRSLSPYVDQFDSMEAADGGSRQIHRRDGEVPQANSADEPCPF